MKDTFHDAQAIYHSVNAHLRLRWLFIAASRIQMHIPRLLTAGSIAGAGCAHDKYPDLPRNPDDLTAIAASRSTTGLTAPASSMGERRNSQTGRNICRQFSGTRANNQKFLNG